MRYAKGHKEETRRRIIETASRLFREKGIERVGVDEIMREAGLTHGGFYAHFGSKEELIAESCAAAVEDASAHWTTTLAGMEPEEAFTTLVGAYLDDSCNEGARCPIAMLAPEVARRSERVQQAYSTKIHAVLDRMTQQFGQSQEEALVTLATLTGARTVANAIGDDPLAEELLEVVRRRLIENGPALRPATATARKRAKVSA